MRLIQIHADDNVAVALEDISGGEAVSVSDQELTAKENIARGHKMALRRIAIGDPVVKYGNPIGIAKEEILPGAWVHVHNVRTGLSERQIIPTVIIRTASR